MNNDELLIAIKDMFKNEVADVKNHMGVLVEDLKSDVRAVADGHSILNGKFDELDRKVDKLDRKVDKLETEMVIVKDYVIGVDAKLNEHDVILKRVK